MFKDHLIFFGAVGRAKAEGTLYLNGVTSSGSLLGINANMIEHVVAFQNSAISLVLISLYFSHCVHLIKFNVNKAVNILPWLQREKHLQKKTKIPF